MNDLKLFFFFFVVVVAYDFRASQRGCRIAFGLQKGLSSQNALLLQQDQKEKKKKKPKKSAKSS